MVLINGNQVDIEEGTLQRLSDSSLPISGFAEQTLEACDGHESGQQAVA